MGAKKIAYIVNAPPHSGMGKAAHEMYHRLVKISEYSLDLVELDFEKKIILLNGKMIKSFKKWPGVDFKFVFWLRAQNDLPQGYDLYHLTAQNIAFFPCQPKIVTCHDIVEFLFPQKRFDRTISSFYLGGLKKAEKIIAISDFTKKSLVQILKMKPDKMSVVYNAVGNHFRSYTQEEKDRGWKDLKRHYSLKDGDFILYVGSEHPRKNFQTLLLALKRTLKKKKFRLIKIGLAGLPGAREKNVALAKKIGVEHQIDFIDRVSEEELPLFYNLARTFIFPSLYEGFGLPPLEAMACGCPVISSKKTSLKEVLGEAPLFLDDPKDVKELAAKIIQVLESPSLTEELAQKGKAQVARFSWEASADKLNEVYKEILK